MTRSGENEGERPDKFSYQKDVPRPRNLKPNRLIWKWNDGVNLNGSELRLLHIGTSSHDLAPLNRKKFDEVRLEEVVF